MQKKVVSTPKTPAVPGAPYSPAIKIGQFVFISGQIPNEADADIENQTRQVLEKIKSLVEEAGSSMDNVLKTTVYLTDLDDYGSMNKVYGEFFNNIPPARACVEISKLVLGIKVEIDAIASIP